MLLIHNQIYNWKPYSYETNDFTDSAIPDVVREGYTRGKNDVVYITCEGEVSFKSNQ